MLYIYSLIICSFVTSSNKVLFAHNLDYWFIDTSCFVYADVSDGDCGCSLFSDRCFVVVGDILYTLMYRMVTVDVPCFLIGVLLLSVIFCIR
jgi:hypothetical protein